ncbi:CAP domain-containing protein [Actinomycetospora termitidis]|uniref:CAP domain-containing protein n=1 Tax=Actinomycetospora termitidis TaxID=3053470 RepID=A0ABT7M812_9PSEU|nr:CAP domain-containing protein [Actinomycetospora sp. Odt1-22]MDL5156814.1 CAP domain-containing protein [Actinomycetospora sp. Odt1-22]
MSPHEHSFPTTGPGRTAAGLLAALVAAGLALLAPSASAAPAPTAVTPTQAAQLTQVVALTNQYRQQAGCRPLTRDARAEKSAQAHADWMNTTGTFSHTGVNGSSFVDRMKAAGYPSPGGENIAQGQRDAAAVMTAWMNSPGHRANILNCRFTTIGVGLAGTKNYWVQNFGY